MKKEDLKEFTLASRVCGPTREVQFTTGDVLVTQPALIIKGVSAADAWQIIGMLDKGLFNESDPEFDGEVKSEVEPVTAKTEAEPEKPKKKGRKAKAQKLAVEENEVKEASTDEKTEPVDIKPKKSNGTSKAGINLEQFKSATGLRELVGDFKEAGIESKEEVIAYCLELQEEGLRCLKGVNIDRRVGNLWDRVA